MRIGQHETHPLADVFPLLHDHALAGLVEDIKANGLMDPIVIHDGKILDGRNRYRACLEAGVAPVFQDYEGSTDPADLARYVISRNLARRDMTLDQRALVSRRLSRWTMRAIKLKKQLARVQPLLPSVPELDSAAEQVLADATPEVLAAVDRGDLPLTVAADVAALEPDQQRAVIARLDQPEPEPVRHKREEVRLASVALDLTAVDVAALTALVRLGERSVHAEARRAAELLRRLVPCIAR